MTFIVDGTNGLTFPNSTTQASGSKVLQVVNASYGTQVSTSSGTYSDTGLTATITPLFATSKILVLVDQVGVGKDTGDLTVQLQLVRNSTALIHFEGVAAWNATATRNYIGSCSVNYLDSPATTSATTYKTQFAAFSPVPLAYCQFNVGNGSGSSTITLMEIAV